VLLAQGSRNDIFSNGIRVDAVVDFVCISVGAAASPSSAANANCTSCFNPFSGGQGKTVGASLVWLLICSHKPKNSSVARERSQFLTLAMSVKDMKSPCAIRVNETIVSRTNN